MLILNAPLVRQALPMSAAIDAMKRAFAALGLKHADAPRRMHMAIDRHAGTMLVMPTLVVEDDGEALAVKVITLFDHNAEKNLPRIQASVLALDPETGEPLALLAGATLTAIRTAAASGAATDLMARPDSHVAAIFGAGAQSKTHLEAMCVVRDIEKAWIYDVRQDVAEELAAKLAGTGPFPKDVRAAETSKQAVSDADIICTVTTSHTPVFDDADLKTGTHINAVGSFRPEVQEIPSETVGRSRLVVDDREAALDETGDLIQPIRKGLIVPEHIQAELGDLVLENAIGRTSAEQITLFKSVGVGVQDAVAARAALAGATEMGLGIEVEW